MNRLSVFLILSAVVGMRVKARLGEAEGSFDRKYVYWKQGDDFEGERKVGPFYRTKKRLYQSKEPETEKAPRTHGSNPLFLITVTFVNGQSQHEDYNFTYNRNVDDGDVKGIMDANGGQANWAKSETTSKSGTTYVRKDGRATLKVAERRIELFSDIRLRVQEEELKQKPRGTF